jgi:glycosyltransferase EpsE
MSDKKISVIMSVFNDEANIENSINSILSQTYKEFELLVLDDFSSDSTPKILNKFKHDARVKIYSNDKNIGLTKSLNFLIEQSTGMYIFRQDSDDYSLPSRFIKQLNILENTPFKVCTTRAFNIQTQKKIPGISSWFPKKLTMKFKNPYIHGTLSIEKTLLKDIGNYDEGYLYSQDFKLYLDIIKKNEKIYEIKEPLYMLNTSNNISTNQKELQKSYFDKALKENK